MPQQPPADPGLHVERDDDALVLRIHNPDRANAIDDAMLAELVRHLERLRPEVRAVVLTGTGSRHFCSGLDLGGLDGRALEDRLRRGEALLGLATAAIAACPRPVIAAVNGAAFGGGLELAVACDWRIAAETAVFGMPAARLGVVYAPDGVARFLALLGPARTRQLFLTGQPLDAPRAFAIGLVDELVPADALQGAAARAVGGIAAGAPVAIAGTRAAIGLLSPPPAADAAAAIELIRRDAYASPEFAEGLAAFRERRPPWWSPATGDG